VAPVAVVSFWDAAAGYRGLRTVEIDGRRVTCATATEMAAAIADLERRRRGGGEAATELAINWSSCSIARGPNGPHHPTMEPARF
jgi:hypothetical protein